MFFAASSHGGGAVYTISASPAMDSDSLTSAPNVAVTVNADGTIDGWEDPSGAWAQRNASTDWCIPNESAPTVWVRFSHSLAAGLSSWKGTVDGRTCVSPSEPDGSTWYALTGSGASGLTCGFSKTLPASNGIATENLTIEIATDSGGSNIIATGTITMNSQMSG